MSKIRTTIILTAALATTLALTACSSNSDSGSMPGMDMGGSASPSASGATNSGPHNDADVAFAMDMVPHHKQAVEMADMILKKDGISPEVITLAKKIKAAQGPEITTMTAWLKTWGTEPAASMPGMDMGTGMMSEADMNALDKATGPAASKLFLQQMMQHHNGAITMAQTELSSGKNPDAVALAKNIVKAQTAEIAQMQTILKTL